MVAITAPPHPSATLFSAAGCEVRFRRAPLVRLAASSSFSPRCPCSSSSSASFSSSSSSSYGGGGVGGGDGGKIHYVSPPAARPGAPVYVTLPADAVGPGGRVARCRAPGWRGWRWSRGGASWSVGTSISLAWRGATGCASAPSSPSTNAAPGRMIHAGSLFHNGCLRRWIRCQTCDILIDTNGETKNTSHWDVTFFHF